MTLFHSNQFKTFADLDRLESFMHLQFVHHVLNVCAYCSDADRQGGGDVLGAGLIR